jgi:hypothetical protein
VTVPDGLGGAITALGGMLAEAVTAPADPESELGGLAAAGPRAARAPEAYALLVEAIHEGYLQHYGVGRVLRSADPDLALLAGDRLYALGLARLAELGDLAAVAELADVISLAAQAHAEDDPSRAAAVWRAGAHAVGAGTDPDHEARKLAWRGAA